MYKKSNDKKIDNNDLVNVKVTGNVTTITKIAFKNREAKIMKLNKDEYVNLATGEVKEFKHNKNRSQNLTSVRKSITKLKDYINCNITNPSKCRFLTLTYKQNMTDSKQTKKDCIKFLRTLKSKKYQEMFNYNSFEYIIVNEPQGRGCYHLHVFLIFDNENVKIPKYKLNEIWTHGFVDIKQINLNSTDIGNYFCYIFSSMTVGEIRKSELSLKEFDAPITKKIIGPRGGITSKRIVKGARLKIMDTYTRLYSFSKGIKKPDINKDLPYKIVKDIYVNNNSAKLKKVDGFYINDKEGNYYNKVIIETYESK